MPDPVEVALARIETKLDTVIGQGRDHEDRLRAVEGHDLATLRDTVRQLTEHVQSLQRWRWLMTGAAAAAGAGAAEGARLVGSLLAR